MDKGTAITCSQCSSVVFIAVKEVCTGAPLRSDTVSYPDGSPVEHFAKLVCKKCGHQFVSINTQKAQSIP